MTRTTVYWSGQRTGRGRRRKRKILMGTTVNTEVPPCNRSLLEMSEFDDLSARC